MAPPVTREEAIRIVAETPETSNQLAQLEVKKQIDSLDNERIMALIIAEEKKDIVKMRRWWSNIILWCIVGVIAFDLLIVPAIGLGWLKFEGNTHSWPVKPPVPEPKSRVVQRRFVGQSSQTAPASQPSRRDSCSESVEVRTYCAQGAIVS